jgi:hypothetical protein
MITFAVIFQALPIEGTTLGLDWRNIHDSLSRGVTYFADRDGLRNPPWSILPLIPLGGLPFGASWGIWTFITVLVIVISVPRNRKRMGGWALMLVLLTTHYTTLRNIADGNVEALIIGGALLILLAFPVQRSLIMAAGVLLVSAKVQESWLLLLILPVFLYQMWDRRAWMIAGGVTLGVVALASVWRGQAWLDALIVYGQTGQGEGLDISLLSIFNRFGIPVLLYGVAWVSILIVTLACLRRSVQINRWELNRSATGLLITAAMLLAPYTAGNSTLTPLVILCGALYLRYPRFILGMLLILNLQYFVPITFQVTYVSYYSFISPIGLWVLGCWAATRPQVKP